MANSKQPFPQGTGLSVSINTVRGHRIKPPTEPAARRVSSAATGASPGGLVTRHQRVLLGHARAVLGEGEADFEDAVQEVFTACACSSEPPGFIAPGGG